MHIHNSGARNGDHHILLIITGNVHKQRILSQIITKTFQKCEGGGIETQL